MATSIKISSGSVFNGNPITVSVRPSVVKRTESDGSVTYPSFHRAIVDVNCARDDGKFEYIRMSRPILGETGAESESVEVDISSALRTFRDSYEYSPLPVTYPIVKFSIRAYEEYMLDGEVHKTDRVYLPGDGTTLCTLFGAFSDMDRLTAGESKEVKAMTRKPTSGQQLVAVGDTYAFTPSYTVGQTLLGSASLVAPTSQVVTVAKAGAQTLGGRAVYALPDSERDKRQTFRFINHFGVLESVNVPKTHLRNFTAMSDSFVASREESFNRFSRSIVRKTNDVQTWTFSSDPLNEEWLGWYLHEFLMSEHIWMELNGNWIPCTIMLDDDITIIDSTKRTYHAVKFEVGLGVNGDPYSIV